MDIRIGCSGFSYKEWKNIFYPDGLAQKNWFKYYCEHFNTIEINSSFYKMPSQTSFNKWHNESPDDFLFTIKAPRLITHYKQLQNCDQLLSDFYQQTNNGLKNKLGCILFQFPPKFTFTVERLELLLNLLHPNFKNVVEFRDASWWQQAVFEQLKEKQIIFCGQSYPSALPDDLIQNNDIIYYRFHGKPVLYKSTYPEEMIVDFANKLYKNSKQAFIYFNNTWGIGALTNAKQLQHLIQNSI